MSNGTLTWREGWLCILEEDTLWSQPIRIRRWWPIKNCPLGDWQEALGTELAASDGEYGGLVNGRFQCFRLLDGGQTAAKFFEQEPIPPPKVREGIKTRYERGRWEKYLQSRGWVAA